MSSKTSQRNITCLCLAILTLVGSARAELDVAADGNPLCDIVLAADASAPEKIAARELALYLGKATGAEFLTLTPERRGDRPVIAVGPGAAKALAPDLNLAKDELGEDGIVIHSVGDNLVLSGAEGAQRGTLYAVYEFLERAVGVRWWTPTAEFVPEHPDLVIPPQDIRYVPPHLYREVFGWGMVPKEQQWGYDASDEAAVNWPQHYFAARMRNNGHGTSMPASLGGCIVPLGWCHTFYRFIPPAKYFAEHPEWFSLVNGKRTHDHAQLCMTNDEMLKELTQNVLEAVRAHPELGMVVVTQGDWTGNCECESCAAIDQAEGTPMGSILYGVNKVAEAVEKEFPAFLVATHAYMYSVEPPQNMRPRDNVVIWYCVHRKTMSQPVDSDVNRKVMEQLQAWSKIAPKLIIWDYMTNIFGPFTLYPNIHTLGKDFRAFQANHAVGVFAESESVSTSDNVAAKMYVMSKLLWDPSQDENALIAEFMEGYFGAAAPHLKAWRELVQAEAPDERLTLTMRHSASWLGLEAMNNGAEFFRKAEAAVADDPVLTERVRRARVSLDHQWLYDYRRYCKEAKTLGIPFNGPKAPEAFADELAAFVQAQFAPEKDAFLVRVLPRLIEAPSYQEHFRRLKLRAITEQGPLPPYFAETNPERIIDIDEFKAFIHPTAQVVDDPKASNGLAMRVPTFHVPSWAVQARTGDLERLGGFGRYRVYVVARVEPQAESGMAFEAGVFNNRSRKSLAWLRFPIGAKGAEPDRFKNTPEAPRPHGTPVSDGEYHLYDMGTYTLDDTGFFIWVGSTTGDLYVDRFIYVRESDEAEKTTAGD